ncbi:glucose 1-dehydrogenase [Desulfatitalea alkaliphila]|uniref:Glucose 1-dehydrogenase n=1 Tax=Desulfatitalea alkaliphila TaxID=2929485 RepID=A0AA41UHP7_9BACT|nr:glucose 1-dehydrogenase [Desulfatitalea alkaliphila]MCJ8499845.1 glucose 1-dehydrogenase [Desulfatitalea alkaliphila]
MDLTQFSLEGKVAVVTGGSRGIGRAAALAMADAGAHVVVSSRKIDGLEPVAAEISSKGVKGLAIAAHVGKMEDAKALIDQVMQQFGRLDILVNNAGTNPYFGKLIDQDETTYDITMNVNLKSIFFLSQMAAKIMKTRGGGSIINTSSIGGIRAGELGVYCVSKAAVIMMTQVMAKEWGQYNIRVNAIAPGIIKTRLSEALWKNPEVNAKAVAQIPMLRLGEPQELAGIVVFLASRAGSYVTGETIVVDGGRVHGEPAWLEKK